MSYSSVCVALETFAAVIVSIILVDSLTAKGKPKRVNKYYFCMLSSCIALLITDTILWQPWIFDIPMLLAGTVFSLAYIFLVSYFYFFTIYMLTYISEKTVVSKWWIRLASIFAILSIVFWLVFFPTYRYYEFDVRGTVNYGTLYGLAVAIPALVLVVKIIAIFRYSAYISIRDKIGFFSLTVILMGSSFFINEKIDALIPYLSTAVASLVTYVTIYRDQEKVLAEKEKELARHNEREAETGARLAVSQIQPHFIFNTLNSIYYLVGEDPEQAQEVISEFSDYLRMNIDTMDNNGPIPFSKELEHIKTYLKIEQLRFDKKLKVEYDIKVTGFDVLPLTIQPIVENAVKHGICAKDEGGTVYISSEETENAFVVIVEDEGIGFDTEKVEEDGRAHVGMNNIRRRLSLIEGSTFDVVSEIGKGTKVTVTIPKMNTVV